MYTHTCVCACIYICFSIFVAVGDVIFHLRVKMKISEICDIKYTALSCSSRTFTSISELSANMITFPGISIDFGMWILNSSFVLQLDTDS